MFHFKSYNSILVVYGGGGVWYPIRPRFWPLPLDFFTPYWVVHCPHKSHIFYSSGGHLGKSIFMEYLYIQFTKVFWNVTHFYDIITFLKPKFSFSSEWDSMYVDSISWILAPGSVSNPDLDWSGPIWSPKRKYFSDIRGFFWGSNALFTVLRTNR